MKKLSTMMLSVCLVAGLASANDKKADHSSHDKKEAPADHKDKKDDKHEAPKPHAH